MFVVPIPKRTRQMHVVNRGSSRASGKQARDPSRLLKFIFGGVDGLLVRFALTELVLWVWHNRNSHERMEQASGSGCHISCQRSGDQDYACNVLHHRHDNGGRSLWMSPSIFQRWQALSRSWSSTVSSALTLSLILVM